MLREILKNGESDWEKVREIILDRYPIDEMFEKIFAKLGDEQKEKILEGFWKDELKTVDTTEYEKILDKCPDKERGFMSSIVDYVVISRICSGCRWKEGSVFNEFVLKKKEESFVDIVRAMISYNEEKSDDVIQFIRTDTKLCFCKVPFMKNMFDKFMFDKINKHIPGLFKFMKQKELKRTFGKNIISIEMRLNNYCGTNFGKFKKEVEMLKKREDSLLK